MNLALIAVSLTSLSLKFSWVLIDASLKATALLAMALVANLCLRRASASVRDRIWMLAFCATIILPLVSSIIPHWQLSIAGFNSDVPLDSLRPTSHTLPDNDQQHSTQVEPEYASNRIPIEELRTHQPDVNHDRFLAGSQNIVSLEKQSESVPQVGARGTISSVDPHSVLLIIWLAGASLLMTPFVIASVTKRNVLARCQTLIDTLATQTLKQASIRLGLSRPIRLLLGDDKMIPMTLGTVRPTIVLPGNWNTWPQDRLRFVMLHELAHIKRLDVLFQSIARIACAFHWFNPLAWYALHRMRFDCELACDDQVISSGEPSSDYASELIEIARIYRPSRLAGGIAMAR